MGGSFSWILAGLVLSVALSGPAAAEAEAERVGAGWVTQAPWLDGSDRRTISIAVPAAGAPIMVLTGSHLFLFTYNDPVPYAAIPLAETVSHYCGVAISGSGNSLAIRDSHGIRVYRFEGTGISMRWEDIWDTPHCGKMWFTNGGERLYMARTDHSEARDGRTGDILWTFQNPIQGKWMFADYAPGADKILMGHPGAQLIGRGSAFILDGETGLPGMAMHLGTARFVSGVIGPSGDVALIKTDTTLRLFATPLGLPVWTTTLADERGRLGAAFLPSGGGFAVSSGAETRVTRVYSMSGIEVSPRDFEMPGQVVASTSSRYGRDQIVTIDTDTSGWNTILRIADAETGDMVLEKAIEQQIDLDRLQFEARWNYILNTGKGRLETYSRDEPDLEPPEIRILPGLDCPFVEKDATRWWVTCTEKSAQADIRFITEMGQRNDRLEWQATILCSLMGAPRPSYAMDGWTLAQSSKRLHLHEIPEEAYATESVGITYPVGNETYRDHFPAGGVSLKLRYIDDHGLMDTACVSIAFSDPNVREASGPGLVFVLFSLVALALLASLGIVAAALRRRR